MSQANNGSKGKSPSTNSGNVVKSTSANATKAQRKTSSSESSGSNADKPLSMERIFGGISLKALEGFCRRLSIGLRSGVDLLRILETEAKVGSTRHRQVVQNMIENLRAGHTLADAFALEGAYFPTLLIKMVDAGEHAGGMDRTFLYMADYYQDLKRTRSDFLSQIFMPVIQLCIAMMIICLLIFVNGFFKSGSPQEPPLDLTGVGLRGGTGVLIFLSIVLTFTAVVGVIAFGIWKNWFGCHKTLVPLVRNIPVIGPVFTTTALSRLSMTLSMLLGAGVDARRSVRDALLSTGNYYYISGLGLVLEGVEQGKSFSESLDAPKVLPNDFIQALEVGELSGSDSESLERLAVNYRERAQAALKALAITAGVVIWMMIAAIIIAAIFTIFFQILKVYTGYLPK